MKQPAEVFFRATLERVTTDRDGESKVTFLVPKSDLPAVTELQLQAGEYVFAVGVKRVEQYDGEGS
jgi:hypothetical protein